jgi:hypothetical protein
VLAFANPSHIQDHKFMTTSKANDPLVYPLARAYAGNTIG